MKTPSRRGRAAFTLIELMAVITIIVILAGIIVGGLGYVNEKQAREKAKLQIALLSKALEEYKMDTGSYPLFGESATGISSNPPRTSIIYLRLYQDGLNNNSKIYLPELDPDNNKQGWISKSTSGIITIVDPWGQEYRYRSSQQGNANGIPQFNNDGSPKMNTTTYNPDFDLWSVGKDGKTNPNSPNDQTNLDDVRNF